MTVMGPWPYAEPLAPCRSRPRGSSARPLCYGYVGGAWARARPQRHDRPALVAPPGPCYRSSASCASFAGDRPTVPPDVGSVCGSSADDYAMSRDGR